jgi:hypothetical protein
MSNAHNSGTTVDGGQWDNRQRAVVFWLVLTGMLIVGLYKALSYLVGPPVTTKGLASTQHYLNLAVITTIAWAALIPFSYPVRKIENWLNSVSPHLSASSRQPYSLMTDIKTGIYMFGRWTWLIALLWAFLTWFMTWTQIMSAASEVGQPFSQTQVQHLLLFNTYAILILCTVIAVAVCYWLINRYLPPINYLPSLRGDSA